MPGIFLLLQVIFLLLLSSNPGLAKMVSVEGEKAQLMSGPGKNFPVKCEYDKGFPLNTLSTQGQWVKVEDFEKDSGWILKNHLANQSTVIVKANKNTQKKINIRNGPGNTFKVVGQAFYGVVFKKIEQKKGWVKVQHHESGLTGWVNDSFLWGN
jgi:SH3-like domain-containing protein